MRGSITLDAIYSYDIIQDNISLLSVTLPQPKEVLCCRLYKNAIICIGGSDGAFYDTIEISNSLVITISPSSPTLHPLGISFPTSSPTTSDLNNRDESDLFGVFVVIAIVTTLLLSCLICFFLYYKKKKKIGNENDSSIEMTSELNHVSVLSTEKTKSTHITPRGTNFRIFTSICFSNK